MNSKKILFQAKINNKARSRGLANPSTETYFLKCKNRFLNMRNGQNIFCTERRYSEHWMRFFSTRRIWSNFDRRLSCTNQISCLISRNAETDAHLWLVPVDTTEKKPKIPEKQGFSWYFLFNKVSKYFRLFKLVYSYSLWNYGKYTLYSGLPIC